MTTDQSIIVSLGMCLAGLTGFLFERTSFGVGQKLLVLRKSLQIGEMSNVTNLLFLTKLICTEWARSLGQAKDKKIHFFQHGKQTENFSKLVHVFFVGTLVVLFNMFL